MSLKIGTLSIRRVGDVMNNPMPERINVMKVITYDVDRVMETIHNGTDKPFDDITLDDVMEYVEGLARDDFSCGWGHEPQGDLIFQTEDGEDL